MKYEFRNANNEVCCSGDVFAHLCAACQAKAARTAAPPPPDLATAIRAAAERNSLAGRAAALRVAMAVENPISTTRIRTAAASQPAPAPPSLIDAIRAAARGAR